MYYDSRSASFYILLYLSCTWICLASSSCSASLTTIFSIFLLHFSCFCLTSFHLPRNNCATPSVLSSPILSASAHFPPTPFHQVRPSIHTYIKHTMLLLLFIPLLSYFSFGSKSALPIAYILFISLIISFSVNTLSCFSSFLSSNVLTLTQTRKGRMVCSVLFLWFRITV